MARPRTMTNFYKKDKNNSASSNIIAKSILRICDKIVFYMSTARCERLCAGGWVGKVVSSTVSRKLIADEKIKQFH